MYQYLVCYYCLFLRWAVNRHRSRETVYEAANVHSSNDGVVELPPDIDLEDDNLDDDGSDIGAIGGEEETVSILRNENVRK